MISKRVRVTLKRIFWVFVPAVLVLGVGVLASNFYVVYRFAHPERTQLYGSPRDFQVILQKPMWSEEKWKNADGTEAVGWFLSRGVPAPAIILSHAYGSNRSELLTLCFELWKTGYHVLLYDLRGHGESPVEWSGLGTHEVDDLLAALRFIRSFKNDAGQLLIDGNVGLYGVHLGGYVSLIASAQDPSIKAVAVDSVYPNVAYFFNHRLKSYTGDKSAWANELIDAPWRSQLTELSMQLYLLRREDSLRAIDAVSAGSGKQFLFITAANTGMLDTATREVLQATKGEKELVEVEHTRLERLYDKASSNYDARVVTFFREALPPSAPFRAAKGPR